MRTLTALAAGLLAAGFSAASFAQSPEPAVWQGDLFITEAPPPSCLGDILAGDFYRSVYRPFVTTLPNNRENAALAVFSPRSAFFIEANPGTSLAGKNVKADAGGISSHATFFAGSTTVDLTITPTKITAATPVVQISGTLDNFFGLTGCNVVVVGALGLRHD
jgi:hypothetical protein